MGILDVFFKKPAPPPPAPPIVVASACVAETMQGYREGDPPPMGIEALRAPVTGGPETGICEVVTSVFPRVDKKYQALFLPCQAPAAARVTGTVQPNLTTGRLSVFVTAKDGAGQPVRARFHLVLVEW